MDYDLTAVNAYGKGLIADHENTDEKTCKSGDLLLTIQEPPCENDEDDSSSLPNLDKIAYRTFCNKYKPFMQLVLITFCVHSVMTIHPHECAASDYSLHSLSGHLLIQTVVVLLCLLYEKATQVVNLTFGANANSTDGVVKNASILDVASVDTKIFNNIHQQEISLLHYYETSRFQYFTVFVNWVEIFTSIHVLTQIFTYILVFHDPNLGVLIPVTLVIPICCIVLVTSLDVIWLLELFFEGPINDIRNIIH